MIIKATHTRSSISARQLGWILVGGMVLLGLSWGLTQLLYERSSPQGLVQCGAERVKRVDATVVYTHQGQSFLNGETQSSEMAHTGRFSCKVDSAQPYGMLYILPHAQPGDRVEMSVWRYGNRNSGGQLVFSIMSGSDGFYRHAEEPVMHDEAGWEKLQLNVKIPTDYEGEEIRIYVYTQKQEEVYFDDLRIWHVSAETFAAKLTQADSLFPALHLEVGPGSMAKLEAKRREALRTFLLQTEADDWVKGHLKTDAAAIPVKLRLKGDQPDHLRNKQWSFRIKVKEPHAWNQLLTFSVHNAKARHLLHEWVYHQFMRREDILATRYDFLPFYFNSEELGLYAFEEHFEKQLPESQQRREGVIVKFDEDPAWKAGQYQNRYGLSGINLAAELNTYESAEILPFREKQTYASEPLRKQFQRAKSLMQQYKTRQQHAGACFDLERLGKYYALIDLNEAYHSIVWHNQRFYYNPVTSRLEPIAFDGFTELGPFNYRRWLIIGAHLGQLSGTPMDELYEQLFLDPAFVGHYVKALFTFTDPSYLDNFFFDLGPALQARQELIKRYYPAYQFDPNQIRERAKKIRSVLAPLSQASIKAFTQATDEDSLSLRVANFHRLPLKVVGYSRYPGQMRQRLHTPLFLPAFMPGKVPNYQTLSLPAGAKHLYFQLPGQDQLYESRISPWPISSPDLPGQSYGQTLQLPDSTVCQLRGQVIQFLPGKHIIQADVHIPAGYELHVAAGASLDFQQGAAFFSRSPVFMIGEADSPILITSSDTSAKGFTVMEASKHSRLSYVQVEGFNTLDTAGWTLTGAVTFYESAVELEHCHFTRNLCEDALNLVRCDFTMESCVISETPYDGFDADFCQGFVSGCRFIKLGNDGMDFSGSVIRVSDCEVQEAGDKGMSVGEQSQVTVQKLRVANAAHGVVAKDLSTVTITELYLRNCKTGLAAYRKKPEFGGAQIQVNQLSRDKVRFLHRIEAGSSLHIDGKTVGGN